MNRLSRLLGATALLALASLPARGATVTGDLRKFAVGAQASSWQRGHDPRFAFDDDPGTRWASAWKDDQWISIDLGQPRTITEIILRWENAYPSEYRWEVPHNGTAWRPLGRVTTGRGGEERHAVPDVSARFVRLVGLRRATQWGISLREFVLRGPLSEPEPELGGSIRPRTWSPSSTTIGRT